MLKRDLMTRVMEVPGKAREVLAYMMVKPSVTPDQIRDDLGVDDVVRTMHNLRDSGFPIRTIKKPCRTNGVSSMKAAEFILEEEFLSSGLVGSIVLGERREGMEGKSVKVKFDGPLYECAEDYARRIGLSLGNDPGVATLCRRAVRAFLNKEGYKAVQLDRAGVSGRPEDGN